MTEAQTAAPETIQPRDRIILALDVDSADAARRIVGETGEIVGGYKIGLQLFTAAGPSFVRKMCEVGHKVFLDLKFHDIPNTVAKAGVEAVRLGVWMFNVHALGGNELMRRVVSEVGAVCERESIARPKIIAVTVLTSSSDDTLREIGIEANAGELALQLAGHAKASGLDGVVASPQEASEIKSMCGKDFIVVTPGIRPINASNDDQKRVMTPAEAVRRGADHLVIGRPITTASDMKEASREILNELSASNDELRPPN
jgi:orotidine-5'-phosphate decarboxylase